MRVRKRVSREGFPGMCGGLERCMGPFFHGLINQSLFVGNRLRTCDSGYSFYRKNICF